MMSAINWEWKEHYAYLFELQESGATNMYGASPYLVARCGLDRRTAQKVLISWMENYGEIAKEMKE
tara:strand:+ start:82 stop:279 length:198 start_codon:yes stop_codon:yes gene_type:complete